MRYEIRPIYDPVRLIIGPVIARTDDYAEADAIASAESIREYGVVIVDTVDRLIDWGDRVTTIQEWLLESADAQMEDV